MALAPKPKPGAASVDVDALINKGLAVRDAPPPGDLKVILRIPAHLIARVDDALHAEPLRRPRHTWLLEAILEKLERLPK